MENNKLWFKAKSYGYGWYPSSWQGWSVIGLYTLAVTLDFVNIDKFSHSASDTIIGVSVPILINTVFLLITCHIKGEKPEWRWGKNEDKK